MKVSNGREYPDHPIVGVGGVVISNGRVLLIRRGNPPLVGEWSIPGGTLEVGETLPEAVKRELAEEAGIEVRVGELIEALERIFLDPHGRTKYHHVILDYLCEMVGGNTRAGSDATEVAWATQSELDKYELSAAATRVIQKAFQMIRERNEVSAEPD
jgi:8-oxo-dGTP diphosphatase